MKKLFKATDYVLLGLAGVVDIYNDLKDPFGVMGRIYKDSPQRWIPNLYKKTNYYGAVYYGLRTGYIEKIIKGDQPFIRLSVKGREKIQRDFPISHWQKQRWDKKWRIVIFDIEEKQKRTREALRYKLRELGFGMIQESVWISPYDVIVDFREFIKSVGLGKEVFAMEVSGILAGDIKSLVSKIWSLEKINSDYEELYHKLKKFSDRRQISTKGGNEVGMKEEEMKKEVLELKSEYLGILREDPCLPKELLPEDWLGEKVKRLLRF